jgi:selenophosphate synthase
MKIVQQLALFAAAMVVGVWAQGDVCIVSSTDFRVDLVASAENCTKSTTATTCVIDMKDFPATKALEVSCTNSKCRVFKCRGTCWISRI